ncbi:MAG: hypothetical protein ABS79_07860 [Planctomycetes bacterium SCN 63-9]|nr:MAG: hypothetical protein ABS79_07860 [Planctomycetes bacterium SCN 63-9]
MRTRPRKFALAIVATLSTQALAANAAPPTTAGAANIPAFAKAVPKVRTGAPVLAFNGKDLTGFYTYLKETRYEDPKKVISVKDGAIRVSGEDYGGFTTREEYQDYHLVVEWKWGGAAHPPRVKNARDSGILLHCVGPDGSYAGYWMESQECQIIEGGTGDFIMVGSGKEKPAPSLTADLRIGADKQYYFDPGSPSLKRAGGRNNWWGRDPEWKDEIGFYGKKDLDKPAGEWNTLEVICDGDSITNIVNGYVANAATKSSLTRGKILFQSEGAEILFRKIEVRPLIK